jgi:Anti-sigma-K factor rskA
MPETPPPGQPDEAMIDLLVKQVTEGLSSAEQRELDVMDSATASAYLRDFERAAAAVTVAGSAGAERLPSELAQRIARQADEHFAAVSGRTSRLVSLDAVRDERPERGGAAGWWAAAACLVLAVFSWLRSPPPAPVVAVTPPVAMTPAPPQAPALTPAEARTAMLANPISVKGTLGATQDPAAKGVSGDFVWDPLAQKGFLHFVGLAANDPAVSQYQIWIFDGVRDQKYPVDGGVFDVPAGSGEVVIPINAALNVSKLAAFAVTVEKPGGVVVSSRQHVVVLGATG